MKPATERTQQQQQQQSPRPKPKPAVALKPQLRVGHPVNRDADKSLLANATHSDRMATLTSDTENSVSVSSQPLCPLSSRSPRPLPGQNATDNLSSSPTDRTKQPNSSGSPTVGSQSPALPSRTRQPRPSNTDSPRALPLDAKPAGQVGTPAENTLIMAKPLPPAPPSRQRHHQQTRGPAAGMLYSFHVKYKLCLCRQ